MNNIKTDFGYNDYDYVQDGETIKELTVTITLDEYRNLITINAQNEARIEYLEKRLSEEVSKRLCLEEKRNDCIKKL